MNQAQNTYIPPTAKEIAKALKQCDKDLSPQHKDGISGVYEDPLYSQPLANIPVQWCSVHGDFKASAKMEEGEPVLTLEYNGSDARHNEVRLGFNSFTDMKKFIGIIHTDVEFDTSNSQFKVEHANKNVIVKRTAFAIALGMLLYLFKGKPKK